MIQFSRPKKSLAAALDPFKRRDAPASEYLSRHEPSATVPPPAANRFDPAYYRTHEPVSFVAPDAQSIASQAITNNVPILPGSAFARGRPTYGGYASSIASQQPIDTASLAGQSSIGYSQFDRLDGHSGDQVRPRQRRLSAGSLAPSDAPTASMYGYNYKAGDDDTRSVVTSQAGVTDF